MSLYHWFIPQIPPTTSKRYLPDSSKEASQKDALEVEAANQHVEKELGRKDAVHTTTMILSFVPKLVSMLLPLATKLL